MRILFVVPYTPDLIRVRPYNLIRHLARRGHQVSVVTLSDGATRPPETEALAQQCQRYISQPLSRQRAMWNCLRALPSRKPLQAAYSWHPGVVDELETLVRSENGQRPFDVIHVEHLRGSPFGVHLRQLWRGRQGAIPIVWDSVDCISALFEQAAENSKSLFGRRVTRFELARTRRHESWLLGQFDRVLVTSAADKAALQALRNGMGQAADITVLPNGVDTDYFAPDPEQVRQPESLVVSGKMSYHANVTMALHLVEEILPQVWAERPAVQLLVVGKDPPPAIERLSAHPQITVTGTVPDIRPYLWQSMVAVAPLTYGAGIQNKVLEAMACGTPVVATAQATRALAAVPGRDLLVADDAASFAANILTLLDDRQLRQTLADNGRIYVRAKHDWDSIAAQLESIYQSFSQV